MNLIDLIIHDKGVPIVFLSKGFEKIPSDSSFPTHWAGDVRLSVLTLSKPSIAASMDQTRMSYLLYHT